MITITVVSPTTHTCPLCGADVEHRDRRTRERLSSPSVATSWYECVADDGHLSRHWDPFVGADR